MINEALNLEVKDCFEELYKNCEFKKEAHYHEEKDLGWLSNPWNEVGSFFPDIKDFPEVKYMIVNNKITQKIIFNWYEENLEELFMTNKKGLGS